MLMLLLLPTDGTCLQSAPLLLGANLVKRDACGQAAHTGQRRQHLLRLNGMRALGREALGLNSAKMDPYGMHDTDRSAAGGKRSAASSRTGIQLEQSDNN